MDLLIHSFSDLPLSGGTLVSGEAEIGYHWRGSWQIDGLSALIGITEDGDEIAPDPDAVESALKVHRTRDIDEAVDEAIAADRDGERPGLGRAMRMLGAAA